MADDREKSEPRRPANGQADVESFDNRRHKPKTVTRAPADKLARPGGTKRGYETK